MQTDFLAYLLDVEKTKSLSKTAERFFISYQSVRAGITNLERQFGVELIYCNNKGCYLTDAGKLVVDYGKLMFCEEEKLKNALKIYQKNEKRDFKNTLKLYVFSVFVNEPFLNFVKNYQKSHSNVILSMQIMDMEKIIQDTKIDEETLVLGVEVPEMSFNYSTMFKEWKKKEQLNKTILAIPKFYMCVSKKSPWAQYEVITEDNCNEIPLFGNNLNYMDVEDAFKVRQTVNGFSEQLLLVQSGLGGAIYNDGECRYLLNNKKDIVKIPIDSAVRKEILYVCLMKSKKHVPEYIREFIHELRQVL